jgi:CubicO group peptidase (beta-lactamase class C family)
MPLDATMWLASCTKLIGTVAAMQCVERGQLKLDDDISTVLPELKELEILTGFEQGPDGKDKPILVKNTKPITLRCVFDDEIWTGNADFVYRQLLTHSSGLGYDVFSELFDRRKDWWLTSANRPGT